MPSEQLKHICIFYPTDIVSCSQGGIETFIKDTIIRNQSLLKISFVGVSTDTKKRPIGKWTICHLNNVSFEFLPVCKTISLSKKSRFPLVIKYIWSLFFLREIIPKTIDIFELHRIEPMLVLSKFKSIKVAFFHQNMSVVGFKNADIRWKYFPKIYFWLEKKLTQKTDHIYCVNSKGVDLLKKQYPNKSSSIYFTPTWFNKDLFSPLEDNFFNEVQRTHFRTKLGLDSNSKIIIYVGRLDEQKNPELLINAFSLSQKTHKNTALVMIGDGVLSGKLKKMSNHLKIKDRIFFMGMLSQVEVVDALRFSDVFALSSNYEGMSIAVLEALACGLPVVATDVGENSRVISNDINGYIVQIGNMTQFSEALNKALLNSKRMSGKRCCESVFPYQLDLIRGAIDKKYIELIKKNYADVHSF